MKYTIAKQSELNANDAKAWTGDTDKSPAKIDVQELRKAYKRKTLLQKLIEVFGS